MHNHPWFFYALLLGSLFILIFFFMASTVEKLGISVNAVSSKMAVVIPLSFSFLMFGEALKPIFALGLLLSLLSIYLISVKTELRLNKTYILLPVIVFVGSGLIDTSLKLFETNYTGDVDMNRISYSIFLGAFITGVVVQVIRYFRGLYILSWRNTVAGIALGIPNYYSIFVLLLALQYFSDNSALVFSLNNISIVLLSSLLSVILFKERLNLKNRVGIIVAVISILIIAYAQG